MKELFNEFKESYTFKKMVRDIKIGLIYVLPAIIIIFKININVLMRLIIVDFYWHFLDYLNDESTSSLGMAFSKFLNKGL